MNFTLRRLCAEDLAAADQLRADLGWNQTILDWQRLLALSPEGCFVAEQTSRIVGTCTDRLPIWPATLASFSFGP